MLASTASQLSDSDIQRRTANLFTLNTSGIHHEPVLLSPGKWMIGSAPSNQIVLNDERIAQNQFLIIVTEHRSIIKDWSGAARWNDTPFENAVLSDGDVVQIADIQLTFRLAESRDLISQLPCVSEPTASDKSDTIVSDRLSQYAKRESTASQVDRPTRDGETGTASSETASSSIVENRLDGLIARIESTIREDSGQPAEPAHPDNSHRNGEFRFNSENSSQLPNGHETGQTAFSPSVPTASDPIEIDWELQQLEELRAAVKLEHEQLLAKREVLAQETMNVQKQLDSLKQNELSNSNKALPVSECNGPVLPVTDSPGNATVCDIVADDATNETPDVESCDSDFETFSDAPLDYQSINAQTIDETTAVTAEREKLRHYLEEFDSSDEASTAQDLEEEEAVAVGAAQLSIENTLTNAMRTRDDAVRQLDDLVLAATRSLDSESGQTSANSISGFSSNWPPQNKDGLLDRESQATPLPTDPDESESAQENVDLEASVDDLGALVSEAVSTDSEMNSDETHNDIASREMVGDDSLDQSTDTAASDDHSALLFPFAEQATDEALSEARDVASASLSLAPEADTSFDVSSDEERAEIDDQWQDDNSTNATTYSDITSQCEIIDDLEAMDEIESAGVFASQNQDVYETTEELATDEPDTSIFEDRSPDKEAPSLDNKVDASHSNSLADSNQAELELPASDAPSWFDSTLMAEDESVSKEAETSESSTDAENSDGTGLLGDVEASSASQPEADAPGDLRKKLAEMFDLPTLSESETPASPDSSVEQRLQQLRGEGQPEEPADRKFEPESPWKTPVSLASIDESATDSYPEGETDSDGESALDYDSETLDQFPASQDEEKPSEESQLTEPGGLSAVSQEEDLDGEVSISDYMERLLARNRKITGASPPAHEDTSPDSESASSTGNHRDTNKTVSGSEESEKTTTNSTKPETWLADTPRHRLDRDQVRAEVDVLRQVANQSARSAVATASRRNVRNQVIAKTVASILALSSGVAALLLEVSLVFGLIVLTIGMVFSVDLTLTIFRNWKQHRAINKAATVLAGACDDAKDGSARQPE